MQAFRKLLVANRGEIARRIIAAARDMGIATVAVYSDADEDAIYVGEADEAVHLPGVRADVTYLDISKLVEAASRSGADALHPGYGFLAESPALNEACEKASIVFVGPPADAMRAMSRKVEAKVLAARAGVPVLPTVAVETGVVLPGVEAPPFPLLVKASAGGGGTGIRTVRGPEELSQAVEAASRDALAAFGDATVFLEPLLEEAHHVEVQVLSDGLRTVHLFERECSVQRRHQKLIEEAPSPTISPELRDRMTSAAVSLATAVGYVGAGTVEFLVQGESFYFLEMNTRLQVEHRVTERVTGIDLVRAQLEIASGRPLAFGQEDITLRGHAIEGRLYAEDPANGYAPTTGTILHYSHDPAVGVLFDDAIAEGSRVSPHYDGLLAKVVASGDHRDEAVARLARSLRQVRLDGIVTNRDLLVGVLEDSEFLDDGVDTGYLARRSDLAENGVGPALLAVHGVAAAVSRAATEHAASPLSFAPLGWRKVAWSTSPVGVTLRAGGRDVSVALSSAGRDVTVRIGDHASGASAVVRREGALVDVVIDGVRHRCDVRSYGDRWSVNSAEGQSEFTLRERSQADRDDSGDGVMTAPVPGTVISVQVAKGDRVGSGDVLVVIEAMKMEHRITAPFSGVVEMVAASAGDVVDAHQVLLAVSRGTDDKAST
jgi:propionyl-CoA carboxylase alpha chain